MAGNTNKVIWITGASSGIGEALAYELNKKGHRLIISARDKEKLQQVRSQCQRPDSVRVLTLDISKFEDLPNNVDTALGLFQGIDMLVNNAGISQRSLIVHTELSVYQRLMDVNYLGTIALTKALLPHFIQRKSGHFVTVTSLMGKFGSPYRSGYCGTKHALHGFFDVLRMEHEKDGIAVTLICPGFVQTDVAKNALTADGSPQMRNDDSTAKGMPVRTFAKKMIKAMESKKFEVYFGGKEAMGVYLKRFFPKLLHKLILRSKVT